MSFVVGDLVRLRFGHTPLQVIQVYRDGRIRAKYCHKYQVTNTNFKFPQEAMACVTRQGNSEFVFWDGYKPHYMNQMAYDYRHNVANGSMGQFLYLGMDMVQDQVDKANEGKKAVEKKYILKRVRGDVTAIIGTLIGHASQGRLVLEFTDGRVEAVPPSLVKPYGERVIRVKAVKGSYQCCYIIPDTAKVHDDDILLSDSGNLYRVINENVTEPTCVKGPFKGKKMISTEL